MPEFHSLEQPQPKEVEKLTKELKRGLEAEPRLTFIFPLNENRESALEMIKSEEKIRPERVLVLLESEDFIEKQAGVYLLSRTPKLSEEDSEKSLPILEKLREDNDLVVRGAAVQALGNLSEKSLPILLPILEKLSKDNCWDVKKAAIQSLVKLGEKSLPILEKLSKDKDGVVKKAVAQALGNLSEKSLPILLSILEKLSKDKDWSVKEAAIQSLGNLGEESLPILKRLSKDKDRDIRKIAVQSLENLERLKKEPKFHPWLLSTRKPLFATIETKKLTKKLNKIQEIFNQLKKKFKDDFIGITIFGSTAKGYSEKKSDLDWGIIAKDRKVSKKFKRLARALRLCSEHYVGVDINYEADLNREVPFYGLFFGDHEQLKKLQRIILENTNNIEWDIIRRKIQDNETNLAKAASRYNLTEEEVERIKQFVSLLRVPPSYQEALKIVEANR